VPSPVRVWGLAPEKKINFALKLCNSEQVLVLLSYITAYELSASEKVGGGHYPQS